MMKKIIITGALVSSLWASSQVGIQTTTPQKTLHVNGSLQVVNELNVGGGASTAGSSGTLGQVLKSNGPGQPPIWSNLAGVPSSTGTVIAINGQFLVAQEITAQMTADFVPPINSPATPIGNLNSVILDNENKYLGSSTTNSFKVVADGVYQIMMNVQLQATNQLANAVIAAPVIGIWDDTTDVWVARVNDTFIENANSTTRQTYTLITAIPMLASKTYSFRVAHTSSAAENLTIKQLSSGSTGSGPVTQVSVKRLK